MASVISDDLVVGGSTKTTDVRKTDGSVFDAERFEQQYRIPVELYGPTTTVAALTKWLYTAYGSVGEIVTAQAFIAVVASGADRTITVDIQKSTAGGAFATVMAATVGFTNASTVRTAVTGTFSDTSLVPGDVLRAVVTVAGAAGAQAQGLFITLTIRERPTP
jgi:hypothetical protein